MPKRGESIWKRKNGRWEARYIKERDLNGKAIYGSVYGATYTEVKKKRESVLVQLSEKQKAIIAPNTFELVIEEYLEAHKLEVKPSTYARYTEISAKHLIPDLGAKSIAAFTLADGNSYVKTLMDRKKADGSGLAPKTVRDIISLLKQTLKYAERKEYIARAKTDFILPKQERPHIQILCGYSVIILPQSISTVLICPDRFKQFHVGHFLRNHFRSADFSEKSSENHWLSEV